MDAAASLTQAHACLCDGADLQARTVFMPCPRRHHHSLHACGTRSRRKIRSSMGAAARHGPIGTADTRLATQRLCRHPSFWRAYAKAIGTFGTGTAAAAGCDSNPCTVGDGLGGDLGHRRDSTRHIRSRWRPLDLGAMHGPSASA